MSDDWQFELDDSLLEQDGVPLWFDDEIDTGDAEIEGDTPGNEYEAWLRDLPDDIRADLLSEPCAEPLETEPAGYWHHDIEPGKADTGFAAGGTFDTLAPGPELAHSITATDAARSELGESALIGVLCAWQRLAAWAQAGQAATLMTLACRRETQALELRRPSLAEHVSDEVAAALRLTCRSANQLLATASGLSRLPDVHAALTRGEIDWQKACLFVDLVSGLPDDVARAIASSVLGRADSMTSGQLRAALTRAVMAYDPEAAERRREEARVDSGVHIWTETSGNAALVGRELRPSEVVTANEFLSAHARWLKSHGVDGSVDQLRAAVFVALLNGRSVESLVPSQIPGPTPTDGGACRPDAAANAGMAGAGAAMTGTINLTMPFSAWLGSSGDPGELAGYGPVDAATCRQLADAMADGARWCLTLTDSTGRAAAHACARKGPGRSRDRCTGIRWTQELKNRLQLLETAPCGHARQSESYKPPGSLRHLVEIRQRTCSFPGCRRAARRCDLDHTTPFDLGGLTCECNLAPLCRRHHQAKQTHCWRLTQPQPGRMMWRLPSGRIYQTTADPY